MKPLTFCGVLLCILSAILNHNRADITAVYILGTLSIVCVILNAVIEQFKGK